MKMIKLFIVGCVFSLLVACAKPLPQDKLNYVGEWHGLAMSLRITQDGSVAYYRQQGGADKSIKGPLKSFDGDNFVVGIGPVATTFVVSKPPYQEDGRWKMVVDGVELTKRSDHF
ncbi:hypothetical protein SAMN05421749_1073 [Acinetobacter marinus]|uniref:Uncharacterized protein n=1 Tax=Acinetobacter marinus TaxID=281375 RepID=A0A1G6MGI2_9GAMM|nr:hypothetical protein [Acinetobacter marinus]SDC54590.1 hypothetical protein SAMN05421749_1073 [Acinetobacter marinus]